MWLQTKLCTAKVESGQLTEEAYAAQLRARIEVEKTEARALIGKGKKDWAALAIERAKIMQAELKQMAEQ